MVTQLGILTAVRDGRETPLRAALAVLPNRSESPFAKVRGTHNGRFVVVNTDAAPSAPLRAGGLDTPLLMCAAVIDREPSEWLHDLLRVLGSAGDDIWSNCPDWPIETDARVEYLLAHRTRASLDFATWDAPVGRIHEALALRDRVVDFAVRTQRTSGDELLAAYREEFSP
ncbi:MAG: hypothetical protein QNM02_11045 [Acidimicrobiia bacterium]|nr:hypothetical protein [Acidimicrobiia bacterium]